MGQFRWKNKNIEYRMKGDKIEVRIMNEDFHVFYKKIVALHDKKGMRKLMKDLSNYGITFEKPPTDWFE